MRLLQNEKAQKAQAPQITTLIPIPTPQLTDIELLEDEMHVSYELELEEKLSHRLSRRASMRMKLTTLMMISTRM